MQIADWQDSVADKEVIALFRPRVKKTPRPAVYPLLVYLEHKEPTHVSCPTIIPSDGLFYYTQMIVQKSHKLPNALLVRIGDDSFTDSFRGFFWTN